MTNIIDSQKQPYCTSQVLVNVNNVTGDGTVYQPLFPDLIQGSNFSIATGVATATIAGLFIFMIRVCLTNLNSSASLGIYNLVTTAKTYSIANWSSGGWRSQALVGTIQRIFIAPMNVGDTAYVTVQVSGTTKVIGVGNSVATFNMARLG